MQSFMDTAGPPTSGGPLSPSSLFTFDGEQMMMSNGGNDDGVDLFRYYMDLQAFQSKDNAYGNSNNGGLSSTIDNSDNVNTLSSYNAFFNPSAYSRPSPSTSTSSISPSSLSSISQQHAITQEQQQQQPSRSTTADSSSNLFPFAEASSSLFSTQQQPSSTTLPPSYDASALLSFDHLAGSENPQPIDPHLLMGNNGSNQAIPTSRILPTVKEEEVEESSSAFPLNAANNLPLSNGHAFHPAGTNATASASTSTGTSATHQPQQPRQKQRSVSATASHFDDSMNGIDGLSDEEDSESEEEEVAAPASRKRGAAASASSAASKKRTSATKASSSSGSTRKTTSGKRETSIFSQQQHPHALVPVPEYEDRLSKAEYDKLSSKEKRQMRNKISARNFRHRRKAHIDTLEALVEDKDRTIRVLSEEVGTLRTENQGLRADIEVLKKNWESIAAKIGAATTSVAPSTPSTLSQQQHQHHLSPDEDDLYGAPGSLPALSPAASSSAESTNGDHLSEVSFEQARVSAQTSTQGQAQASQARPSTSASTASSSSNKGTNGRVTRSSIQRPNLRKDLGPSGTSFSAFGSGRTMNVHTTLIPELNFNFPVPPPSMFSSSPPSTTASSTGASSNTFNNNASSGRTSPASIGSGSIADMLAGKRERDANANASARLNMNPALNGLTPDQIANLREQFFNANSTMLPPSAASHAAEDNAASLVSGKVARNNAAGLDPLQYSFFDTNPFISLRQDSLQDYRAQLYAKLANNVAGIHQAQQSSNSKANDSNGNGMNGLRPAFFAGSPQASLNEKDAEVAKIASIAQKTLFDKLSTAFWDAFAGNNTSATRSIVPSTSSRERKRSQSSSSSVNGDSFDGQKVADVIAGRSRLQIVNVEQQQEKDDKIDSLARQVENMGLKK